LKRARIFRKGEELELTIERYAFGGKGIARVATESGPFTVFVENTFPGQRVRARVVSCKPRHAECSLVDVLERADVEQETGFQEIPGAPYARIPIELQRKYKEETALELFSRIGGQTDLQARYAGIVASPDSWHYRNKMEYSFGAIVHNPETGEKEDRFGLGFKRRGTWKTSTATAASSIPTWKVHCTESARGAKRLGYRLGMPREGKGSSAFSLCARAGKQTVCSRTS
jgi:tRNA/tmRNA/rRNA uracil-C5-methylase (TrmA/RlmC/RlmD family)